MRPDLEASVSAAAAKTAVWSGVVTAFWGFFEQNLLGVVGAVVTVLTLLLTAYYKRREDRRREAHDARERELHAAILHERALRRELLERARSAPASCPPPTLFSESDMGQLSIHRERKLDE